MYECEILLEVYQQFRMTSCWGKWIPDWCWGWRTCVIFNLVYNASARDSCLLFWGNSVGECWLLFGEKSLGTLVVHRSIGEFNSYIPWLGIKEMDNLPTRLGRIKLTDIWSDSRFCSNSLGIVATSLGRGILPVICSHLRNILKLGGL